LDCPTDPPADSPAAAVRNGRIDAKSEQFGSAAMDAAEMAEEDAEEAAATQVSFAVEMKLRDSIGDGRDSNQKVQHGHRAHAIASICRICDCVLSRLPTFSRDCSHCQIIVTVFHPAHELTIYNTHLIEGKRIQIMHAYTQNTRKHMR
jgi:hypothetical protein